VSNLVVENGFAGAAMLRKATVAFIMLFGFAMAIMAQGDGEWIKYNSPEGRYSVSVPHEPKISIQESSTASGEILSQYLASSQDENGVFMIGYFDHGTMSFSFDDARNGMMKSANATLLGEGTISLGSWPGRTLKALGKSSDGEEFIIRTSFFDVGARVYILNCIFPKGDDSPALGEKCTKFFDSFKVNAP
jgi:hypothetical protein